MPFVEAQSLSFTEDFKDSIPFWNAQVCFLLEGYFEKQGTEFKNLPQNNMIQKTLEYVRKLNNYSNWENLNMATELLKKDGKFTFYEAALINNLNIGSVDEAFTLIPTLKDKFPNSEQLATILNQLSDYQKEDDTIIANNNNNNSNSNGNNDNDNGDINMNNNNPNDYINGGDDHNESNINNNTNHNNHEFSVFEKDIIDSMSNNDNDNDNDNGNDHKLGQNTPDYVSSQGNSTPLPSQYGASTPEYE